MKKKEFFKLLIILSFASSLVFGLFSLAKAQLQDEPVSDPRVQYVVDFLGTSDLYEAFGAESIEYFGIERLLNESRPLSLYNSLFRSFSRNAMGETIYPDYFGGAFIDDCGNLVLLLLHSTATD
ncbi:MAG: hypothetical protein FWB91_09835 [Defluviitaleaceae bacterium]|nr:hypothetical protein [Defluviitaleaceae bacterium]